MLSEPARSPPAPTALLRQTALAALATLALALAYLHPILARFGSHIAPDPGDPLFVLYLLKWGTHQLQLALTGHWPDFWNAPFFYPSPGVIALSEHLAGPALFTAAFTALVPNPVAAYNTLFLGSFVLCGASTFWILRRSGLSVWGAWLGAAAFAFSAFRWDQASHLQMLLAGLIPPVLWTWDRLLAAPTRRRAGVFLALYFLHLSGGLYLSYMIHVPLAVLALCRWRELRGYLREPAHRYVLAAVALSTVAVLAVLFGPYLRADRIHGIERPRAVAQQYGATLLSYLNPGWWSIYSGPWPDRLWRPENSLFAGFLPTGLAVFGLLGLRRAGRQAPFPPLPPRRRLVGAGLLAAAGAGLLLGDLHTWSAPGRFPQLDRWVPGHSYLVPGLLVAGGGVGWLLLRRRWRGDWPLRWLPDPWIRGLLLSGLVCFALSLAPLYRLAWDLLPGLAGMRVPARFYPFVSLPLALLAGRGLDGLLDWFSGRIPDRIWGRLPRPAVRWAAGLLAAALLAVDLAPRRLPWIPVPSEAELAPVHAWIAGQPEVRTLLVLPWDGPEGPLREIAALYDGTRHWKPLVNGYSGHFPDLHRRLHALCCAAVPAGPALAELRAAGVTHVLVHVRQLPQRWQRRRTRAWPASGEVEVVYDDGPDVVFGILPTRRAANVPNAGGAAGRAGRAPAPASRAGRPGAESGSR